MSSVVFDRAAGHGHLAIVAHTAAKLGSIIADLTAADHDRRRTAAKNAATLTVCSISGNYAAGHVELGGSLGVHAAGIIIIAITVVSGQSAAFKRTFTAAFNADGAAAITGFFVGMSGTAGNLTAVVAAAVLHSQFTVYHNDAVITGTLQRVAVQVKRDISVCRNSQVCGQRNILVQNIAARGQRAARRGNFFRLLLRFRFRLLLLLISVLGILRNLSRSPLRRCLI